MVFLLYKFLNREGTNVEQYIFNVCIFRDLSRLHKYKCVCNSFPPSVTIVQISCQRNTGSQCCWTYLKLLPSVFLPCFSYCYVWVCNESKFVKVLKAMYHCLDLPEFYCSRKVEAGFVSRKLTQLYTLQIDSDVQLSALISGVMRWRIWF